MKYILFGLFFIITITSCKSQKKSPSRSELLYNLVSQKDPFDNLIPDSLRYLQPILDSVWIHDQILRSGNATENDRKSNLENVGKMQATSKENLAIVLPILEKYGWLSYREIGLRGSRAIFLTIQHADLKTQEKYFPLLKEGFLKRKLPPSDFASMHDRIEFRNNRPQKYGTQLGLSKHRESLKNVFPLLNADSVDTWRNEMGLDSIKNYLKRFDIIWDKGEYKKLLPELLKTYNIGGDASN